MSQFEENMSKNSSASVILVLPLSRTQKYVTTCDIRPEWTKRNFVFEFLSEHLTERIDGFYGLVALIERLDESGGVSFD